MIDQLKDPTFNVNLIKYWHINYLNSIYRDMRPLLKGPKVLSNCEQILRLRGYGAIERGAESSEYYDNYFWSLHLHGRWMAYLIKNEIKKRTK